MVAFSNGSKDSVFVRALCNRASVDIVSRRVRHNIGRIIGFGMKPAATTWGRPFLPRCGSQTRLDILIRRPLYYARTRHGNLAWRIALITESRWGVTQIVRYVTEFDTYWILGIHHQQPSGSLRDLWQVGSSRKPSRVGFISSRIHLKSHPYRKSWAMALRSEETNSRETRLSLGHRSNAVKNFVGQVPAGQFRSNCQTGA